MLSLLHNEEEIIGRVSVIYKDHAIYVNVWGTGDTTAHSISLGYGWKCVLMFINQVLYPERKSACCILGRSLVGSPQYPSGRIGEP